MLLYLNPFNWVKRKPYYKPSEKTSKLLYDLNKKYNVRMEIGSVNDTIWYFRDLRNGKISKLENFQFIFNNDSLKNEDLENVRKYVDDFRSNFEHKKYFDSINVVINYDSIFYKTKMK